MKLTPLGPKARKLAKHPLRFVRDAIWRDPKSFPSFHRMFLVERIEKRGDVVDFFGQGVAGFETVAENYRAVTAIVRPAILSTTSSTLRIRLKDTIRVDLKNPDTMRPGRGFRFSVDFSGLEPGDYQLYFQIDGQPQKAGCVDNYYFYRARGAHRLATRSLSIDLNRRPWNTHAFQGIDLKLTSTQEPLQVWKEVAKSTLVPMYGRYAAVRLLYWATLPFFRGRVIWLLAERGDTAQDNAYQLYRSIRSNHPDIEAYYLIDKSAADLSKVATYGNTVDLNSLRHLVYLLHCSVAINAYDIDAYMIPRYLPRVDFLREMGELLKFKRVFLQHGITHNDVAKTLHLNSSGFDLVCSASPAEARYLSVECCLGSRVKLTGFPRFDYLQDTPTDTPYILLMPTWRCWLVSTSYENSSMQDEEAFLASDYFHFYNDFLKSPELQDALEGAEMDLVFFVHYEMQHFLHLFETSERVRVVRTGEVDVQKMLCEARLLITDYSSVFFDFAKMMKPIIYTPFDDDEFFSRQYGRGYFQIREHGFGPSCDSPDSLLYACNACIGRDFQLEPKYRQRIDSFFATPEGEENSSDRVVAEIGRMLAASNGRRERDVSADVDVDVSILAEYRAGQRDFSGRTFSAQRIFDETLCGASFEGAHLRAVEFLNSDLSNAVFSSATLEACTFDESMCERTNWTSSRLRSCKFQNSVLQDASFRAASIRETSFSGARLDSTDFSKATLHGVDLSYTVLDGVSFVGASFEAPNFVGANAEALDFGGLQLAGADFRGAGLRGANFEGALLNGARFNDADLRESTFGTAQMAQASFKNAIYGC